jgi:site-specific DNA-methyltransferase (adenine-specific)
MTINKILNDDCIKGMKSLDDNSFDIAIVDPPYNLSKGGDWTWDSNADVKGFGGAWSKVMQDWDTMPFADYFDFTLLWLSELKRVITPKGSIWIHGTYHNIGIINFCLQILGMEMINEIAWFKRNSFPNLSGRRLTASHETIIWAHTGGKNREYNFNYEDIKKMDFPEDNLKFANKQMRSVWDIPNNKKKTELAFGKHPTQKPIRLINRMLDISAFDGCKVLVPFAGAGSECVAASARGYDFLGFELEKEYIDIAEKRIKDIKPRFL